MKGKIYYLPQQDLLTVLQIFNRMPKYIMYPHLEGIPEGAEVHHVFTSPERMAIGVVVTHDSFEDIPEGQQLPVADQDTSMEFTLLPVYEGGIVPLDRYSKEELPRLLADVWVEMQRRGDDSADS